LLKDTDIHRISIESERHQRIQRPAPKVIASGNARHV
jgi:hypothetical protein